MARLRRRRRLSPLRLVVTALCAALVTATAAKGSVAADPLALAALCDATGGSSWTGNTTRLPDGPLKDWFSVELDEDGRHWAQRRLLAPNEAAAGAHRQPVDGVDRGDDSDEGTAVERFRVLPPRLKAIRCSPRQWSGTGETPRRVTPAEPGAETRRQRAARESLRTIAASVGSGVATVPRALREGGS